MPQTPSLKNFRRIVVKVGSSLLVNATAGFRKSKNLEKNVGEVLASLARLGHVATKDGKTFEIKRAA